MDYYNNDTVDNPMNTERQFMTPVKERAPPLGYGNSSSPVYESPQTIRRSSNWTPERLMHHPQQQRFKPSFSAQQQNYRPEVNRYSIESSPPDFPESVRSALQDFENEDFNEQQSIQRLQAQPQRMMFHPQHYAEMERRHSLQMQRLKHQQSQEMMQQAPMSTVPQMDLQQMRHHQIQQQQMRQSQRHMSQQMLSNPGGSIAADHVTGKRLRSHSVQLDNRMIPSGNKRVCRSGLSQGRQQAQHLLNQGHGQQQRPHELTQIRTHHQHMNHMLQQQQIQKQHSQQMLPPQQIPLTQHASHQPMSQKHHQSSLTQSSRKQLQHPVSKHDSVIERHPIEVPFHQLPHPLPPQPLSAPVRRPMQRHGHDTDQRNEKQRIKQHRLNQERIARGEFVMPVRPPSPPKKTQVRSDHIKMPVQVVQMPYTDEQKEMIRNAHVEAEAHARAQAEAQNNNMKAKPRSTNKNNNVKASRQGSRSRKPKNNEASTQFMAGMDRHEINIPSQPQLDSSESQHRDTSSNDLQMGVQDITSSLGLSPFLNSESFQELLSSDFTTGLSPSVFDAFDNTNMDLHPHSTNISPHQTTSRADDIPSDVLDDSFKPESSSSGKLEPSPLISSPSNEMHDIHSAGTDHTSTQMFTPGPKRSSEQVTGQTETCLPSPLTPSNAVAGTSDKTKINLYTEKGTKSPDIFSSKVFALACEKQNSLSDPNNKVFEGLLEPYEPSKRQFTSKGTGLQFSINHRGYVSMDSITPPSENIKNNNRNCGANANGFDDNRFCSFEDDLLNLGSETTVATPDPTAGFCTAQKFFGEGSDSESEIDQHEQIQNLQTPPRFSSLGNSDATTAFARTLSRAREGGGSMFLFPMDTPDKHGQMPSLTPRTPRSTQAFQDANFGTQTPPGAICNYETTEFYGTGMTPYVSGSLNS